MYYSYKQDHRKILDQSILKSEAYKKEQDEKNNLECLLVKYQTYGRDNMKKEEIETLERARLVKRPRPRPTFGSYGMVI